MDQITMPRLSDSMEEGTIVKWLAADGEPVAIGAELAEIETDKATMEFQSEFAGVLEIVEPEGATIPVGSVIGHVFAPGDSLGIASREAVVAASAASPVALSAASVAAPNENGNGRVTVDRVQASPVARRLAAGLAIELGALTGTGPRGRVVKRDVLAATRVLPTAATASPAAVAVASPAPPSPGARDETPPPTAAGGKGAVTIQEPTRVQATIARRMAEAKASMPEFTLEVEVDMNGVVAMREEIKALDLEEVPSYNDFVIRACAIALRHHPRVNGAWRDGRFELYERINIGVAVAAGDALLVPTVHEADRCSLGEIARQTRRLAAAAREGTLTPAELSAGTFSVSNLGMFGIERFTAVLNPPQAAILAVGTLESKPVVGEDGSIVAGRRMALTLTCDHRILHGADAARFLMDIRSQLEAPLRLAL
jgi:pyruvate dehydrogenase E2 component (dihydrolipoamide acetyltransferase)